MDLEPYDKLIDQIAQQLHDGSLKPSDLNADLIEKTYADLSDGAAAGVGKKWETQYKKEGEDALVTSLKKNLYTFASAKTFAQLQTLNKMLYYQDGKLRPLNEYRQLVKKVNAQYNKNWLQAEHQTAKTAGQMAIKWQRIQRDKDLFPNLKYRTVGDERVRDEHAALNGTVKPVDDPFWSIHYPPNGWRCRCNVVQTAEDATTHKITTQPNPIFEGNVATDEVIFSKKHQYFQLLNTDGLAKKNAELMKLNAPKLVIYQNKETKKKVTESIFADQENLQQNRESAILVVDALKANMEISAHLDGRIIANNKNPEYRYNGKIADLKTPDSIGYKKVLRKAAAQKCEYVIVNLEKNKDNDTSARALIKNVLRHSNVHPTIKYIIIIQTNKEVKLYLRDKI